MNTTGKKTVLLAGFEPFGGFTANSSAHIARRLDGQVITGCRIRGIVLPCVFGESASVLENMIAQENPLLVICVGQASGRSAISPERIAINLDDAEIPDNAGNKPVDRPIVTGGPPAYWSTLPVRAMMDALREQGIPAALSSSAGTFVCNHVFYRLMHFLEGRPEVRGGFVHIPPSSGQGTQGEVGLDLDVVLDGIMILVEAVLIRKAYSSGHS